LKEKKSHHLTRKIPKQRNPVKKKGKKKHELLLPSGVSSPPVFSPQRERTKEDSREGLQDCKGGVVKCGSPASRKTVCMTSLVDVEKKKLNGRKPPSRQGQISL
jgi:hypothetical protein